MATVSSCVLHIILNTFILFIINPSFILGENDELSIVDFDFNSFNGDYTPPSPPPPASPPHPPSLSCEGDLGGNGSFDTICELNSSLNFGKDVYIEGIGSLHILSGVIVSCPMVGCSILVNISGEFVMGVNSSIIAGTVFVEAQNASLSDGSIINVTALAGAPPPQTSGTPSGVQGSGGGMEGEGRVVLLIILSFQRMCGVGMHTRGRHWMSQRVMGARGGLQVKKRIMVGVEGGELSLRWKVQLKFAGVSWQMEVMGVLRVVEGLVAASTSRPLECSLFSLDWLD
ncbi:hypothetical protein CK203_090930 [Vitis vinifera]|uniref:Uncharacterized protein n=1 Tax=Vitis vinifera TaxID=29760 RepID=A0A438DRT8_VITVI|nr:hypothetical protein CK203_090930 [Vitis vinifera]